MARIALIDGRHCNVRPGDLSANPPLPGGRQARRQSVRRSKSAPRARRPSPGVRQQRDCDIAAGESLGHDAGAHEFREQQARADALSDQAPREIVRRHRGALPTRSPLTSTTTWPSSLANDPRCGFGRMSSTANARRATADAGLVQARDATGGAARRIAARTTTPESTVSAAIATIGTTSPNKSASTPATSAPSA
jgi:hypothetical protein